jgi:hypothetical protein
VIEEKKCNKIVFLKTFKRGLFMEVAKAVDKRFAVMLRKYDAEKKLYGEKEFVTIEDTEQIGDLLNGEGIVISGCLKNGTQIYFLRDGSVGVDTVTAGFFDKASNYRMIMGSYIIAMQNGSSITDDIVADTEKDFI